jgi:hypothetical protein
MSGILLKSSLQEANRKKSWIFEGSIYAQRQGRHPWYGRDEDNSRIKTKARMNKIPVPEIEDMLAAGLPLWAAFQLWSEMISLTALPHAPALFEKMVADRVASLRGVRRLQ